MQKSMFDFNFKNIIYKKYKGCNLVKLKIWFCIGFLEKKYKNKNIRIVINFSMRFDNER